MIGFKNPNKKSVQKNNKTAPLRSVYNPTKSTCTVHLQDEQLL